ncbi:polymorphic PE/PPE family protein [Mycobacterium xenopi 4042]|uniref:Polymorphic PE/PPE family protein n=1 Tax=Mycobacterium xenopi 4042 TaxID=1299334 RepID=X8BHC9_MYCXE|nr:polymorphic PE/PPE family protein [Mycobacterium xenopi 4042]
MQSALSQLISLVPSTLQSLAATATSTSASSSSGLSGLQSSLSSLSTLLSNATGAYSPIGLMAVPVAGGLRPCRRSALPKTAGRRVVAGSLKTDHRSAGPLSGGFMSELQPAAWAGSGVGGMGRASLVGGLSVPTSWATAAPALRSVATVMPNTGVGLLPRLPRTARPGCSATWRCRVWPDARSAVQPHAQSAARLRAC